MKDRLHRLVESLPNEEIPAAERYLAFLAAAGDPAWMAWSSSEPDDEPVTEAEQAAVAQARHDFAAGRVHSIDEARRELGIDRPPPGAA